MSFTKREKILSVFLIAIIIIFSLNQYITIKDYESKLSEIYAYELSQLMWAFQLYEETFSINPENFIESEKKIFKQNLKSNSRFYHTVTSNILRNHREVLPLNFAYGIIALPYFSETIYEISNEENWNKNLFSELRVVLNKANKDYHELLKGYKTDDYYSKEFKNDFELFIDKYNLKFEKLLTS